MAMLAQALREQVCRANLDLVERGLVMGTFGNVSGVDRAAGVIRHQGQRRAVRHPGR
jgi:ribulose-5-phosphate 4-epimerase/fuculose-1-phosphate aldolase